MCDDPARQLLTSVFASIEAAKASEARGNKPEAVWYYLQAVNSLSQASTLERDPRKAALFTEQVQSLRGEINRLQNNVVVNVGVARSPALSSSSPAPAALTLAQADALFAAALDLDEQLHKQSGQSGSQQAPSKEAVKGCCDAYIAAADGYLNLTNKQEAASMRNRVASILDRVQAIKLRANPETITSLTDLADELPVAPQFVAATTSSSNANAPSPLSPADAGLLTNSGFMSGQKWEGAAKKASVDALIPTASDIANNSVGSLTQLEIEVLRASSIVNGRVFQPWLPGELAYCLNPLTTPLQY
jgi:hypothetical protein